MRQFTSCGQSMGVSASASVLPMNIQNWFPLELTGLISLQSKGLSGVFSNTTVLRESFPRQVDKESRGPQGERGLEFSRRKKGQTFFPFLHSLGLYNNNVSCLRTVSGLNLLANSVILKCKLWEVFTTSRHSLDYITSLLTLASGYSFCRLLMPMSEAFSISFLL